MRLIVFLCACAFSYLVDLPALSSLESGPRLGWRSEFITRRRVGLRRRVRFSPSPLATLWPGDKRPYCFRNRLRTVQAVTLANSVQLHKQALGYGYGQPVSHALGVDWFPACAFASAAVLLLFCHYFPSM